MVNIETWCPFERIISIFKKAGIKIGANQLTVEFPGFGTKSYNLKTDVGKRIYFAGSFSVQQRLDFLKLKEYSGKVSFDDQNFTFVIHHDLYKQVEIMSTFNKQKPVKNTVGKTKSFYREALEIEPVSRRDYVPIAETKSCVDDFTPFYDYVVFSNDIEPGVEIEIHGPGPRPVMTDIGTVKTKNGDVEIFSDDPNLLPPQGGSDIEQTQELIEVGHKVLKKILYVRYQDIIQPVVLSSQPTVVGGISLDHMLYLQLLKLSVYLEFCEAHDLPIKLERFNDGYVIDLKRVYKHLVPEEVLSNFILDVVDSTEFVTEIFRDIKASEDSINLRVNRKILGDEVVNAKKSLFVPLISGSMKLSTFLLSNATYIATLLDGSITSVFGAINSLNDAGAIVARFNDELDEFELSGRSAEYYNGNVQKIQTAKGVGSFNAKVSVVKEIPDTEGFAIVGFDDDKNSIVGYPDHFMLCFCKNRRLYQVYDPLEFTSDASNNNDVTPAFESCDANERFFYHMTEAKVSSWLNEGGEYIA